MNAIERAWRCICGSIITHRIYTADRWFVEACSNRHCHHLMTGFETPEVF